MAGGGTRLALDAAATEPHHLEATWGRFDPIHIAYESFAMENIEVTPQGSIQFGRELRFKILNHAEYIAGAYLELTFPAISAPTDVHLTTYYRIAWCHYVGIYVFDEIEFKVNNNTLDKLYPEYMDIWRRINVPECKQFGYNDMVGQINYKDEISANLWIQNAQYDPRAPQNALHDKPSFKTIMPLQFWWCLSWTQALPIGILVFSEVWIHVKLKAANQLYTIYENTTNNTPWDAGTTTVSTATITAPDLTNCRLFIDYVYLQNSARDRISTQSFFYLITQVKHTGSSPVSSSNVTYRMPFVLPVSALLWVIRENEATDNKDYYFFDKYQGNAPLTAGALNPALSTHVYNVPDSMIDRATIKILAEDTQSERDWMYWSRYQHYRHRTKIPESRSIYQYSFALDPANSQASGVVNFSASEQNYIQMYLNSGAGVDGTAAPLGIGYDSKVGELFVFAESSYKS